MAEKTEKATPKKLKDSRKKGQVVKSQDFPSAFTFITSITMVLFMTKYLFSQMGGFLISIFHSIGTTPDIKSRLGEYLIQCMLVILNCSLLIAIVTALVGIIVSFLVVGPVFSGEVIKIDFKKLNPVTNLKNMFKLKTWVEMIKSVLKIIVTSILIYSVMYNSLSEIIATAGMPVLGSALVFSDFLIKVIIRVGIFFLIIAVLDLAFQRRNFAKEMRMEKFEVKQELRDTEGDPRIKSQRKQVAQEIAYQEGPSATRKARAVIINPTHIAVAIDYKEKIEPAPRILTMGRDIVAREIIRVAQSVEIPIMRNVFLAQTLFHKGKIGDYVPEETYEALSEVLHLIRELEQEREAMSLFK